MEKVKSERKRFHFLSRKIQLLGDPTTPEVAKYLLNQKIVKNEKQAAIILYGIIFVCFSIVAIYLYRIGYFADKVVLKNGQVITVEQYADGLRHGLYK